MSLSEEQKAEYFKSVCEINRIERVVGGIQKGFGNGVFITPSHVLTAWHVISGAQKSGLEFSNHKGDTASMIDGGYKSRKTEHDLCIVELDKTIGADVYTRPVNRHLLSNIDIQKNGRIGTVFAKNIHGNKEVVADVMGTHFLNAAHPSFSQGDLHDNPTGMDINSLSYFETQEPLLHQGHSGSPILNDDGYIISIFSAIAVKASMSSTSVQASEILKGSNPQQVADFVDNFLFRPESAHCIDEFEV
ncbi:MAG: S1 family peptidase [Alphaproteobacteria bacterium]